MLFTQCLAQWVMDTKKDYLSLFGHVFAVWFEFIMSFDLSDFTCCYSRVKTFHIASFLLS